MTDRFDRDSDRRRAGYDRGRSMGQEYDRQRWPADEPYGRGYGHPERFVGADWQRGGPHTGRGPKGYRRSDERIREDVCERLTQHGVIDAGDVEVEVSGGEVTLRGRVDSRRTKRLAEDVAEAVAGVWDVHNQLRVRQEQRGGQQWVDDQALEDAERMDRAAQAGNTGAFGAAPTGNQTEDQLRQDAERAFGGPDR